MPFRLETMWIRRILPATTLRPNSKCHETSTTATRSSSFLMYEVSLRIFYGQLPFFLKPKSSWCRLLHRWQPIPFLCQKHLRPSLQLACADQTIVNSILSGWTTHIPIFFAIAVARIHLSNALSFQKWLYIPPSNFCLEWILIVLPQHKVIFDNWEHWRVVS